MAEVVRTYHDTGELLSEVYVIDGKKNGIYKEYYYSGQLWVICSYTDDKINGEYKIYYPSGKLIEKHYYINGIKIE
jgi:antitoxin component YwqK of YwqJK toxin-antitoxin module